MDEPKPTFQPNVGSKDKSVGWYDQTFHGIEPAARALLEEYSHIPPGEVDQYVIAMEDRESTNPTTSKRDKAWDIFPYPCIGQFRFLNLSLSKKPSYERLLERLRDGATYLDVGCCIGQDIRKLVHDGAPGGSLHGAELQEGFIGLGYDFFRDRDTLGATLVQADVFNLGEASSLSGMVAGAARELC
ncbi:hypothetical protein SLS64_000231 [Diaporthe eres]